LIKTNLSIEDKLKNMSEDEEDRQIGVNMGDDDTDEESSPLAESIEADVAAAARPVEVVREEIVTVTENPNAGTFSEESVSMIGNTEGKDELYKLVKAHSLQLDRLTATVESLQSQLKQLKGTRLSSHRTISARRSSGMKTKKNKARAKKTKGKSSGKKKK
jgi:hypothetical protein